MRNSDGTANHSAIAVDVVGGAGIPAVRVDGFGSMIWLGRALDGLAVVVVEETSRAPSRSHVVAVN